MTLQVCIVSEAEAEMAAAAFWYESRRTGLGAKFIAAIDEALEQISEHPLASSIWREGMPFRRHVIRGFPFVVFFVVSSRRASILAVAHAKRRPGYWMDR